MEKNETSRVIMVRHGESLGNAEGFFAGQTDIPLTPLGQRQAERTAEYLRDRKIDRIYSSDLIRSMQTAAPTARMHGLEIIPEAYALCGDFRTLPEQSRNMERACWACLP